ncbi:MAG: response regulator [Kofleriaceae bacterium]
MVRNAGDVRRKALVVDDAPQLVKLLETWLTATGWTVHVAHDGKSALAQITLHDPDVVILDYDMPGMSGVDVLRALRKRSSSLPVVFMSGFSESMIRRRTTAYQAFVSKPFALKDVSRAIRCACSTVAA